MTVRLMNFPIDFMKLYINTIIRSLDLNLQIRHVTKSVSVQNSPPYVPHLKNLSP